MSVVLLIFSFLIVPSMGDYFGSIPIEGAGVAHLVSKYKNGRYLKINQDGSFSLNGGGRVYFASQITNALTPDIYWKIPLMNKHFSFTIDVSQVDCHCNAGAYFVQMPANEGGLAGDYYCDANFVNGNFCPEYDLFEGNRYTMSSTLHTCSGGPDVWTSCNGAGNCKQNAYDVDDKLMCPDANCMINTMKPFTVTYFQNQTVVNVRLEQEGRSKDYDFCNEKSDDIKSMSESFNHMVFVASLWGGPNINMNWLDGKTGCAGECRVRYSAVTYSNFKLW